MVLFFQEMGSLAMERGTPIFTCFSSRHYPYISVKRGIRLNVDNEHGHSLDLETYINSTLVIDAPSPIDDIKYQILQKASGVFLWVALAVPMLNKAFDSGKIDALKEQLEKLPSGISHLFNDMLIRDLEDQDAMIICIQLVLFAQRQLSLREVYFAMKVGLDHPVPKLDSVSSEDMHRYVLYTSKGLVEAICTEPHRDHVQFIHESVRGFLLNKTTSRNFRLG